MDPLFEFNAMEEGFWCLYVLLWHRSLYRSVFQSPRFLKQLAEKFEGTSAVYQYYSNGELKGACFLRNDNGVYHFLSDVKSDHNFFVLRDDCTKEEREEFFNGLFEKVKENKLTLMLKNQPAWASYMEEFINAGKSSKLFVKSSSYSVCPILEERSPIDLVASLNKTTEPRRKAGQLAKKGAALEVYRGNEDLDAWVDQFTRLHVQRWENTHTPSRYVDAEQRVLLRDCINAWIEDQVVVRFSLKLGEERIALWICLIQGDTLIRHSTTYDITKHKMSPGKAMIFHVSQWMLENGLTKMDFGEGAEPYKYEFTNKELNLHQVLVSSKKNLPFILKSTLRENIHRRMKKSPGLKKFYYDKIWPLTH
ncbi:MAG TPA: GNAT family N-acetyltransferase [Flavilitoribacter sp.]|nr:GNAT family N-acetyltransferase [Flavilitoribacter sp.]HMQ88937.1 GNAT family N-acetyltransferase [Flavilitoribacter sp.]